MSSNRVTEASGCDSRTLSTALFMTVGSSTACFASNVSSSVEKVPSIRSPSACTTSISAWISAEDLSPYSAPYILEGAISARSEVGDRSYVMPYVLPASWMDMALSERAVLSAEKASSIARAANSASTRLAWLPALRRPNVDAREDLAAEDHCVRKDGAR